MATEPVCPKCGGTGWMIVERAKLSGAEPCDCRKQDPAVRQQRLEARAQIPPLYQDTSFETFNRHSPGNPIAERELGQVLVNVRAYARDFPNPDRPGLLLIGEPGTGKTHLAVSALRAIIAKGIEGWFCSYQALLNKISAGYDAMSNSSDREAYGKAMDVDVLLLDDLGAHRAHDWIEDTINSIITHRCDNKKALIATTNAPDPEAGSVRYEKNALGRPEYRRTLEEYIGARARSRLFEMCTVIRMPQVEDYRLKAGKVF